LQPQIIRRQIDDKLEKRIVIGAIVSKRFLDAISSSYSKEYLQNTYARTAFEWCLDYHKRYEEAPKKTIQDIYSSHKSSISEDDIIIMGSLLTEISNTYETDTSFNADYLRDQALEYFSKRELEILSSNIQGFLAQGKIKEAAQAVGLYKKVAKKLSKWANPFHVKHIYEVFDDSVDFFKLPGALGEMIGNLEREWVLSVMAPTKKGKTWFLQDIAVMAIMSGLKIVFFSLEMNLKKLCERLYKQLTGSGEGTTNFHFPVFDCFKNQENTCKRPDRECGKGLYLPGQDENKPEYKAGFNIANNYKHCAICRFSEDEEIRNLFEPTVWYEDIDRPEWSFKNTLEGLGSFEKMYGGNSLRTMTYPKFSANLTDIERDLDELEDLEGFVPDVIVIDYADILAPEDARVVGRDRINETWMCISRMGQIRHALMVTATQSNRDSYELLHVKQKHTGEDIRKIHHVEVMVALNQSEQEKEKKVMRVGIVVHRDEDFLQEKDTTLLQNLSTGMFHLDSLPTPKPRERKETENADSDEEV
jgi:hypothetical protein